MGLAQNTKGENFVVRSVVKVSDKNIYEIDDIDVFDKYYGSSVRTEEQKNKTQRQRKRYAPKGVELLTFNESYLEISIYDFLNIVNSAYPGDLSKDVMKHLNIDENTETDLEGKRYSRDLDYLAAVEQGDMETAQRFNPDEEDIRYSRDVDKNYFDALEQGDMKAADKIIGLLPE